MGWRLETWYIVYMDRITSKPRKRSAKGYILGRRGFAKISAVEGIAVTADMDEDFRELDRQKLPPDERRRILLGKYGKRR
jgi:hypothetical protein